MKFALLLTLLLLSATAVLSQDTTSFFLKCIDTTGVTPGNHLTGFILSEVGGVPGTDTANFTITSSSPSDSGGFLNTTLTPFDPSGNTSIFTFDYLIGTRENRQLTFHVQVFGAEIQNSPITVQVGEDVAGLSVVATQGSAPVSTVNIFTAVSFNVSLATGRANSLTLNFGDGQSNTNSTPGAFFTIVTHTYTSGGAYSYSASVSDGVSSTDSSASILVVNPCPNGQAANAGNTACQACPGSCSTTSQQLCFPISGEDPVCSCTATTTGPDCSLLTSNVAINQVVTGNNDFSANYGGATTDFHVQSTAKRAIGNTFISGTYIIPGGEVLGGTNIIQTGVAFVAALVDAQNHNIPFTPYLRINIDISNVILAPSTSASNTIRLLFRQAQNNWVDPTTSCLASTCNTAGVPGCRSVTDTLAQFVICGSGGPFAMVQDTSLIGASSSSSSSGFVTSGSLTATVPPTTQAIPNQNLPNIPSPAEPSPVAPPPVVLPPNSPISPSAASNIKPFVMVILVAMSMIWLVL